MAGLCPYGCRPHLNEGMLVVAIGCLSLVVLPLLGLALGGFLGGPTGARWGAGTGFVLAVALCAVSGYALVKAARR